MNVPEKAWKRWERRACAALGGTRRGPLGKHASDGVDLPVALECKYTTRYQLQTVWLEQARRQRTQEGLPSLIAIAAHNDRNPIAVVDFNWLAALLNPAEEVAA